MVAHFVHHLLPALITPLTPFIRNYFSLDYTRAAMVHSAFVMSYGLSQIPSGWLANRIGRHVLVFTGICGIGLAGFLVGLSHTYIMLLIFLVVMGVLGGGYHPSATPMVSDSVVLYNRGRALGFHEIGGGASFFLAPIMAAAIAATWGWRVAFITLAIPTVIFGIIFYRYLSRQERTGQMPAEITGYGAEAEPTPGKTRLLVIFLILSIITAGAIASVSAFLPLYMVDHFGTSEETGASLMALYYTAGLWVSPVGGYISDRLGRIPVLVVNSLIAGAGVYLLNIASYGLGSNILLIILGITTFIRLPVSESYIIGQTTARNRSMIYGIYYFSMTESGAVFAPLAGLLIDHYGFYFTFTVASIAVIAVTLICSVFLWGRD